MKLKVILTIIATLFSMSIEKTKGIGSKPLNSNFSLLKKNCYLYGLTWAKQNHVCKSFVDYVGCYGKAGLLTGKGSLSCDPYKGDTICSAKKPVLCHNPSIKLNRPSYPINLMTGVSQISEFYQGWAGSFLRETEPVYGCAFNTLSDVNKFCELRFGCGYQIVEFHDGWYIPGMSASMYKDCGWNWSNSKISRGGWNIRAYGNVSDSRFWININDQNANCWTQ